MCSRGPPHATKQLHPGHLLEAASDPTVEGSIPQDCPQRRCQSQSWLSPVLLTSWLKNRFPRPLFGFGECAREAGMTPETCFLTRLSVITKDIRGQESKADEAIHRARSQTKELLSSWSLGPSTVTCKAFWFPTGKLSKPSLWGFYGGFIMQPPAPLVSPEVREVGLKIPTL